MSATRAAVTNGDNLEYGDHAEHMIGETGNYIILFKDDSLFDVCELTAMTGHKHNTEGGRPDPEKPEEKGENADNNVPDNIEATYTYSSKFDAEDEEDFPTSCLVVLNGSEKISKKLEDFKGQKGKGVNDILSIVWDETKAEDNPKDIGFSDDTHKYFTLTNSIYFDENGDKQTTKAIPAEFIGKTLAEAKLLTIYVERMVAKFSFELPNKPDTEEKTNIFYPSNEADIVLFDGFDDKNDIKFIAKRWRVEVTGWNVNALETQNYIFKNIEQDNYFAGWNNADNYRAHWSEDPHYANDDYPWQYRKSIDYKLNYYEDNISETANNNLLRNYSFDDLGLGRNEDTDIDFENAFEKKIVYTPENTYDAKAVAGEDGKKHDSRDELLACTHLLVGAELQLKKSSDIKITDDYERCCDLYRDRSGLYYKSEQECFVAMVHSLRQLLISQSAMEFKPYTWNDFKATTDVVVVNSSGEYLIYYNGIELNDTELRRIMALSDEEFAKEIGSLSPATLRGGDGRCLPWTEKFIDNIEIKKVETIGGIEKTTPLYVCTKEYDDLGAVIAGGALRVASKDDIKSLFYEWLGVVDHFKDGKMYYAHGISHYTGTSDNEELYGTVRNTWYQFKLNDIKRIGTPVDIPTQPIVPERVNNNDQINVSIYIIGWHEYETTIE